MATAKKRATIKDVAAHAGVSYQTVSRVINNQPNVTDKTRNRVKQAIDALGYRPNLAARTLPSRRSQIIGLIIPYEADYLFRDPNLIAQISGIDAEANAQGYNLLLSTGGQSKLGMDAYQRFIRNQVADGALVIETATLQEGNQLLAEHGYPYVSIGYDAGNAKAYTVHGNDRAGAREATLHLIEKGHRRIGVINGPPSGAVASTQERMRGYQLALDEANIPFEPSLIVDGDYTRLSGQMATYQLLAWPEPPTAIFAFNDRMAMGAIRALNEASLTVPEDMAVIGFDDIAAAADFNPALSTVRLPSREMGQAAAKMLLRLINGQPVQNREVAIPAKLVIRQSS